MSDLLNQFTDDLRNLIQRAEIIKNNYPSIDVWKLWDDFFNMYRRADSHEMKECFFNNLTNLSHTHPLLLFRLYDQRKNDITLENSYLKEISSLLEQRDVSALALRQWELCRNHALEMSRKQEIDLIELFYVTRALKSFNPYMEQDHLQCIEHLLKDGHDTIKASNIKPLFWLDMILLWKSSLSKVHIFIIGNYKHMMDFSQRMSEGTYLHKNKNAVQSAILNLLKDEDYGIFIPYKTPLFGKNMEFIKSVFNDPSDHCYIMLLKNIEALKNG